MSLTSLYNKNREEGNKFAKQICQTWIILSAKEIRAADQETEHGLLSPQRKNPDIIANMDWDDPDS